MAKVQLAVFFNTSRIKKKGTDELCGKRANTATQRDVKVISSSVIYNVMKIAASDVKIFLFYEKRAK